MAVRLLLAAALIASLQMESSQAGAAPAYALRDGSTNVHAGPGSFYPVIARLRSGRFLSVTGCHGDFSWCATTINGRQGWVRGRRLEFMHAGQRVPLATFYTFFNVPINGKKAVPSTRRGRDECEACP